jgi:1-acyl-sn-glycerol-3-phosphate acyltransferase
VTAWVDEQEKKYKLRRWFLRDVLLRPIGFHLIVKPHVEGLENVPSSGGVILMMNHTVAIDGVMPMGLITHRFVIPVIKEETLHGWFTGILSRSWGSVGIHRGEADREALRTILELLEREQIVMMAPEGSRHRGLTRPKDGLTYIALKSDAVIVPTAVYNAETWVSDLLKPRLTPVQVRFGKPFRLKKPDGRRIPRDEMSAITDEMMYQLAVLLPESYRGDYADLSSMTTTYLDLSSNVRAISQPA